ncbi:DUF916 domain-containing protein [Xylanimonas ulmi]|uniref:DUF916 domain-containing protein n=1 Tax=Xylanimonas ulmi TaxID=228973 RepID=A0A4Q7M067_9MICO|nr:DUF916 domain-containing protein [Xylanibacterium ulmi]RZS60521.1 hypothetical protein EV386_0781 [Xylanibacterium ulmi]
MPVLYRALTRAVAGALLLALLAAGATPVSALPGDGDPAADSPRAWAVVPASADGPDGRGRLDYAVEPGARVEDHVAVRNLGEQPLTVDVYVQDADHGPDGAFTVRTPQDTPTRVGVWLRLAEGRVTVPPRASVVVPFVLDVPRDAEPGDHAGGVLAVSEVAQSQGPAVQIATGTRVYVRVGGPVAPALEASPLRGAYAGRLGPLTPGRLEVETTLVNSGNIRLDPTAVVRVRSLFGLWTGSVALDDTDEILPGGATTTSGVLTGVPPLGPYWLTVEATRATSRGQDLSETVTMTSPTVLVWAPPWTLLTALALLALAVAVGWRNLRRRRRARTVALTGPATPRPGRARLLTPRRAPGTCR